MKKIILLLTVVVLATSGCSIFGTMFSESRKNFDEKVAKIDEYLKRQNCILKEYSNYYNTEKNYYDMDNEQLIIVCSDKTGDTSLWDEIIAANNSQHMLTIKNGVIMGGNIMSNKINKGKMYLTLEAAISKEENNENHYNLRGKEIRDLTLKYDGKSVVLKDKTDYDTYLYGNQQFIYSDIKIMKEIAAAHEIIIEGRSAAGRKYTRTLSSDDLVFFKKMLNIVQEVHSILNN